MDLNSRIFRLIFVSVLECSRNHGLRALFCFQSLTSRTTKTSDYGQEFNMNNAPERLGILFGSSV